MSFIISYFNFQQFRVYRLKDIIKTYKMTPFFKETDILKKEKKTLNFEEHGKKTESNNEIKKRNDYESEHESECDHGYIKGIAEKLKSRNHTNTRSFSTFADNNKNNNNNNHNNNSNNNHNNNNHNNNNNNSSNTTQEEVYYDGKNRIEENKKNYERILIIEKYTKYDNLKKEGHSDNYILKNFFQAYISHFTHTLIVNNIIHLLRTKYRIHVSLLKAYKKNIDSIFINSGSVFSPDAIFSVGGDGTYLESAHIIANKYIIDEQSNGESNKIELVGINSDPRRSEGKLCLDFFGLNYSEDEKKDQQKENGEMENICNDCEHKSFNEFEKTYHKKKKINILFTDVSAFVQDLVETEKVRKSFSSSSCSSGSNSSEKILTNIDVEKLDLENVRGIDYILKNNSLRYTSNKEHLKVNFGKRTNKNETENVYNCHDTKDTEIEKTKKKCSVITIEEKEGKETRQDKRHGSLDYEESDFQREKREIENLINIRNSEKTHNVIISIEEYTRRILENFFETKKCKKLNRKYITVLIKRENREVKTYKSINEVYIYEAIKNNICTYINIDNEFIKKLKSTALLITSGTGSTAWAYNVNKIDKKKMKNIINEFLKTQNDTIKQNITNINFDLFSEYINNSVCFHPSSKYMKCIIKEPVENNVYDSTDQIYKCCYVNIKTCTSNTIVYIDGIYNIKIQPNDSITLFIKDDDFIVTYK